MNLTDNEIAMLESADNPGQWVAYCEMVKRSRNGLYPPDWWETMKLSGRMDRIFARWGEKPELKTEILDN
jgi:hypothetical protein